MSTKISVLMLISRFYPVMAGAETQALRLSLALQSNNIKTTFLTQKLPNTSSHELFDGIEIYRVGIPIRGLLGSLSYFITGFFWILLRRKNYTIVHAHILSINALLASLVTYIFRLPSIIKVAGSRLTGDISKSEKSFLGRLKLKFAAKHSNYFVCPSNEIYEELLRRGCDKSKISIIPNGIDTKIFRPASLKEKEDVRKTTNIPKDEKVIIYTGRLKKGKGVEVLIDAWKRLGNIGNASLIIVGNGPLMRDISVLASDCSSIRLAGWQDNVAEFLMASDIYVLPSFGEGMPNSLLEAMSCSLACIATNIGGINQLILDGENGMLTEPGKPEELAGKIKALLIDSERTHLLGNNAVKTIQSDFTIEKVAQNYIELYKKALNIQ